MRPAYDERCQVKPRDAAPPALYAQQALPGGRGALNERCMIAFIPVMNKKAAGDTTLGSQAITQRTQSWSLGGSPCSGVKSDLRVPDNAAASL